MRRKPSNDVPPRIGHWWALEPDELLKSVGSQGNGLTSLEAADRLTRASRPLGRQMSGDVELAIRQFRNPILLILIVAALVSEVLGERVDAVIITSIVLVSGVLGFVQERGAVRAMHELMTSVQVHCRVLRDERPVELKVDEIVRGDIVVIRAGDIVPGDCVVLESNALHVDESALTGESYPRRKRPGVADADSPLVDRDNSVHLGTHVVSGEGTVVVVETGMSTEFGAVVGHVAARHVPTSFERGVTGFGMLILRWTAVLVMTVFVANLVFARPIVESLLFSLALAVGLTPQMLPAIVTLSLSKGASQMARRRVIVKRLEAIEDIGSVDVLCTDKTGTLTIGAVALDRVEDVDGVESATAARFAWLNARLQSGFPNPIDAAILDSVPAPIDEAVRLAEFPYDFERKRLSVVTRLADGNWMITKGAVEKVIDCCVTANGRPLEGELERVRSRVAALSDQGMRVMAIAVRRLDDVEVDRHGGTMSESSLDLVGLLAFMDPPKPGVDAAIQRLAGLNVDTRLVTGDHRLAARHISECVGIVSDRILTGHEIESMDDEKLVEAAREVRVFAEVTPVDKERIVRALASAGHAVAFLGDGINDAPALNAADVGISVDTAVDAAKDAADIVLLDKELSVISDGVESGRRIFANTLKYVYVTTSANFGNMLSMAAAALFLPFLPLLPSQILLLNFLSDIPGTTIATDRVDEEQLSTPRRWDIHAVRSFMIVFGLTSAVFDILTFVVLRVVVDADPVDFRSGWFIESTITELAAMLVLRTSRPFHRSRPSTALVVSSAIVLVVAVFIPFSWIAEPLGMGTPTVTTLLALLAITISYVLATEFAKHRRPQLLGAFG